MLERQKSPNFNALSDFAGIQQVSYLMAQPPDKEPVHPKALEALAKVQARDFEGSIPLFKEALSDTSLSPRARSRVHANLAFAYFDLYEHFDCFQEAVKSIQWDGGCIQGLNARLCIYRESWSLDAALADAVAINAIQQNPQMDAIQQELLRAKGLITSFSPPAKVAQSGPVFRISTSNLISNVLPELAVGMADNVHFQSEFMVDLTQQVLAKEQALPRVVRRIAATGPLHVVGDIGGNFSAVVKLFEKNGWPSATNRYLFNGNFLGEHSSRLNTLILLLLCKHVYGEFVQVNRGPWEAEHVVRGSGIESDIFSNFGPDVGRLCKEVLGGFPIATIVNDKIFVMNGGLSESTDIEVVAQNSFRGESSTVEGIQRVDTCEYFTFGPDVTKRFLSIHGFDIFIRSSQSKLNGFEYEHEGKVLTVFTDWKGSRPHKSGIATITGLSVVARSFEFNPTVLVTVPYSANVDPMKGIFAAWRREFGVTNPAREGLVIVRASCPRAALFAEENDVVGVDNMFDYMTYPVPGSALLFGFKGLNISVQGYGIQSAALPAFNDHMKTWQVFGSNDAQTWILLDEQKDTVELNGPCYRKTYAVANHTPFKLIKLVQNAKNHRGNWNLCLLRFELFGTVTA
jgi:hypothetical protein